MMQGGSGGAGVSRRWNLLLSLCLVLLATTWIASVAADEEEFQCIKNYSSKKKGGNRGRKRLERILGKARRPCRRCGAIIPRDDVIVEVGGEATLIYCRFNNKYIDEEDVYFEGENGRKLPHTKVNSSTILTSIEAYRPRKYILSCMSKNGGKPKTLCNQYVKAGSLPKDIENLHCLSRNNIDLNCTWTVPENPITTKYNYLYKVPNFLKKPSNCQLNEKKNSCYWSHKDRGYLRDAISLEVVAGNKLDNLTFTHNIIIPEIVVPIKPHTSVSLDESMLVNVSWELVHPIEVFFTGLYHKVDYRQKGTQNWLTLGNLTHTTSIYTSYHKRKFSILRRLPHANVEYEIRVRLHTMAGGIRENMWSDYDLVSIKTRMQPPSAAPKTHMSSFEVDQNLPVRDVYVYFEDVDPLFQGGDNFYYKMLAYANGRDEPLEIELKSKTKAYYKFSNLNFTEYRFKIIPTNEVGDSAFSSEVIIPQSDCMPKNTKMFTAISQSSNIGLYWFPFEAPRRWCPGSSADKKIDSYTIYWCKKTYANKCKEKIHWETIKTEDLKFSIDSPEMYEMNISSLPADEIHTFGIAANTGNYSSGIRWSSCTVDENDSAAPPSIDAHYKRVKGEDTVVIKWNVNCQTLSAVPIEYNISYCQSEVADFGSCISKEYFKLIKNKNSTIISEHLNPGLSYVFSVSARTKKAKGKESNPKLVTMPTRKPSGPPQNLIVKAKTNTTAVISWQPPKPENRNGVITGYIIYASKSPNAVLGKNEYELKNLNPYTNYTIEVVACTSDGCAETLMAAVVPLQTMFGVPDRVKANLDVSNWRLTWNLDNCNSPACSFEVQIYANQTMLNYTILDENMLSLHKAGLNCTNEEMQFSVRAIGIDENGTSLYGQWDKIKKDPKECPPGIQVWPLWLIMLVVVICASLTFFVIFMTKTGYEKVRLWLRQLEKKIPLPLRILKPEPVKEDSESKKFPRKISEPFIQSSLERNVTPNIARERNQWSEIDPIGVSSEGVKLIEEPENQLLGRGRHEYTMISEPPSPSEARREPSLSDLVQQQMFQSSPAYVQHGTIPNTLPENSETERHGRNLSGSSSQDSAVISESQSIAETNPEVSHAYVQHGMIPNKGYMFVRSVPSLPRLYNGGPGNLEKTPQNLNTSLQFKDFMQEQITPPARRASTGYISLFDTCSGKTSPCQKDPISPSFMSGAASDDLGYSKHSSVVETTPPNHSWLTTGYVALADVPSNRSPSANESNLDFVPVTHPFEHHFKNSSTVNEEAALDAYCKVGSRDDGFKAPKEVSSSNTNPASGAVANAPNLSHVEAFCMGQQKPESEGVRHDHAKIAQHTPYVQLADAEKWQQPASHPMKGLPPSRGVSSLERRPVTNGVGAQTKAHFTPSLSKQSSGYVSQEAIHSVVMSPKKLVAQSQIPHSAVLSQSHQASMV